MFCYGEKEAWYTERVPSGMLPAVEIDGEVFTESDQVLYMLEEEFGPLHRSIADPTVTPLRKLERKLFSAWCQWLCYPSASNREEVQNQKQFEATVKQVEAALEASKGPFFLETFSIADVVFVPYVERMNASLFYYKGYTLRDPEKNPMISGWFDALEERETYRGTQSDFHTHAHDLPPQMGGCYENRSPEQRKCKDMVNNGPWSNLPDARFAPPDDASEHALYRVIKHHENIVAANPNADKNAVDEALRCALTFMMTSEPTPPPPESAASLRYIRDRVNVPRDMPIYSARLLRDALEQTAAISGDETGPTIPTRHRRDQNPKIFGR